MNTPTFFLSSTIYDFRDLRSALKYYLEQQGCAVLASEYNDFQKRLDVHSYQACLAAIERADYFVLLIGTRVGGMYDITNQVSITQQEYRYAYELQKTGKLKIITFVRSEVWQLREERKELALYLSSLPYSEAEKKRLTAYPSKFAEDATFLSAFITEVSRNRETADALAAGTSLPPGNWMHVFRDFSDIISTIQAQIFSGIPVEEAALRRLLLSEMRELVRKCIPKYKTNLCPPRKPLEAFLLKHPITLENKNDDEMTIETAEWDRFSWNAFYLIALEFHPVILDTALSSPYFLRFDPQRNSFKETELYRALYMLREEIRRFNESNTSEVLSLIYEHSPRNRYTKNSSIYMDTKKLAALIHLVDRWVNIIELCSAIHAHLDGQEFLMPSLRPRSPVQGMTKELEAEHPTAEETVWFLRRNYQNRVDKL